MLFRSHKTTNFMNANKGSQKPIVRQNTTKTNQQTVHLRADNSREERPHFPKDSLSVQNGAIGAVQSSYRFSREACETLENHYRSLFVKESDRTRFRIGGEYGYKNHQHALGAFLRADFHDTIMYLNEPNGRCLDIGSSPVRMFSRYQNEKPLINRVFMMNPIIDVRDDIRAQDNKLSIQRLCDRHNELAVKLDQNNAQILNPQFNTCHHVGGSDRNRGNCGCIEHFDFITAIDSAYYPGVLEEMFEQMISNQVNGYIVLNDYLHVLLDSAYQRDPGPLNDLENIDRNNLHKEPFGKTNACLNADGDPESYCQFRINHDEIRVTSTVRGNVLPYNHGILNLGKCKTFAHRYSYVNEDDIEVKMLMLFEEINICFNGEIPYKTYKIRPTLLSRWSEESLRDVHIYEELFLTASEYLAYLNQEYLMQQEIKSNITITPVPTLRRVESGESVNDDLFDVESYTKKLTQEDESLIDLVQRRARNEVAFVKFVRNQFRTGSHNISIRYVDKEAWIYIRVVGKESRWYNPLTWFFNVEMLGRSAHARLADVIEAYKKIGVKQNVKSILHSLTQNQRERDDNTGLFNMSDAYAIARVIRVNEETRFENLVSPTV